MRDDGGAAFPVRISSPEDGRLATDGMSLRDYFAASVATIVLEMARGRVPEKTKENLAEACYEFADALLAERAKP